MRASAVGIISTIGLGLCAAAGDVGCAVKTTPQGFGSSGASAAKTSEATPILDNVPATSITTQDYGIASWKMFVGRSQVVFAGYDGQGHAVEGAQVAWFKAVQSAPAHVRVMVLDGSNAAMRVYKSGYGGSFSNAQSQFLMHIGYDFQQFKASGFKQLNVPGTVVRSLPTTDWGFGQRRMEPVRFGGLPLNTAPSDLGNLPVDVEWTWTGVAGYGLGIAAGVAGGVAVVATGGSALVVGAGLASAGLWVGAEAVGLYSYITENPNNPPAPPDAPASQVSQDPQTGQLSATTPESVPEMTFDQKWDDDMQQLSQNNSCPSCANQNGDLDVNGQNGDVSSGNPNDPGAQQGGAGANGENGGSTSGSSDQGAAGQPQTPTDPGSGSSGGSGDPGSSSGGSQPAQDMAPPATQGATQGAPQATQGATQGQPKARPKARRRAQCRAQPKARPREQRRARFATRGQASPATRRFGAA